jgi:hypothetical protein
MDNSRTPEHIEKELQELIIKHNLSGKLSINKVKTWIYEHSEEDPNKSLEDFVYKFQSYFKNIKNQTEIRKINRVFIDAWNTFPHKVLGDLSPNQRLSLQGRDNIGDVELTEIMIPPEMTTLLSIKAKIMGLSIREYILFVLTKHVEESITSSISILEKIFKENVQKEILLPAPVVKRKISKRKDRK